MDRSPARHRSSDTPIYDELAAEQAVLDRHFPPTRRSSVHVHVFERLDPRLGRHQVHDERSRAFAVPADTATRTVMHQRHTPIWDQGDVGSCTANAALGCLSAGPLWRGTDPAWTERDAQALYSEETELDDSEIPGHWPPDDTGSAGLWSAKALTARRLVSGYRHAFSTRAALTALQDRPISLGLPWYESMMDTDRRGEVHVDPGARLAGGHQVCADGIDVERRLVRFAQSWGRGWGDRGWGWMAWSLLDQLLRQGGDVTVFTR